MGLEHLINEAMSNADSGLKMGAPQIKIVGVGGGGGNSIDRISRLGADGFETIAFNTDEQALNLVSASRKVLLGKSITKGFGCGGDPEMGKRCAEYDEELIRDAIEGADILYLTMGLGGGTGTGAGPVVARLARKMGIMVICIASTPFSFERARFKRASKAVTELERECHSLILIDNNKLLKVVPDAPMDHGFCVMDQLITNVVHGITEAITKPSMINLDYADFKTIIMQGGTSTILYGESDATRPDLVVKEVLGNPLLDVDYSGATGALIHLTGGRKMSLQRIDHIMRGITEKFSDDANIIMGTRVDEAFDDTIRVMAIITGVRPKGPTAGDGFVARTKRIVPRIKPPASS